MKRIKRNYLNAPLNPRCKYCGASPKDLDIHIKDMHLDKGSIAIKRIQQLKGNKHMMTPKEAGHLLTQR